MSPRAAWRLESMGFTQVYDYTAGKLDWLAAGLATEGSNAQRPRAGDVARGDVPTCGLDERLGEGAGRALSLGSSRPCGQGRAPSGRTCRSWSWRGSWLTTIWRAHRSPPPTAGWSGCCAAATRPGSLRSFASAERAPRKAGRDD